MTKHSVLSSHENSRDVKVEIADENERYDDTDRNVENYQVVVDVLVLVEHVAFERVVVERYGRRRCDLSELVLVWFTQSVDD